MLTGGRGKAGGIKLADDPDDAERKAEEILGLDINGHVVRKLWIEQASEIAKEYYLSITFDRGAKKSLFMLTTEGGVEIEEVAEKNPDALARLHVDPLEGYQPYQARRLIYGAGIDDPNEQKQLLDIIGKLYRCFVESDAMLCEINPLIVTPEGEIRALDSKFTVDDNALYKHPDIAEMRDLEAYPPEERAAREKGVTYVKLDGEVGILGNGAGLVDVDARRDRARRRPARELLRPRRRRRRAGRRRRARGDHAPTRRCARSSSTSSAGSPAATRWRAGSCRRSSRSTIEHPIVVRLDGTNAEEGRQILAEAAPPNLHVEPTMLEAATPRRGAGGMTRPGRSAPRRTARATRTARAPTSTWSSSGRAGGRRKALDVATGGGHVARRLREAGLEVVTLDPVARDAGRRGRTAPRTSRSPTAASTSSSTRIAPHHFADIRAAVARDGARQQAARRRSRTRSSRASGSRAGREAARPDPRAQLHRGRVARVSRPRPGLEVEEVERFEKRHPTRGLARPHGLRRATRPSASGSCSPTG